jgi:hypothetical protein
MVLNFLRRLAPATLPCLLLLAAGMTVHAQPSASGTPRPDPLDPKAEVPALRYESSFAQPPRAAHPAPIGWRDANEAVTRIGGWRAYAREARQPEPAPPPAAAPAPAPAAPASAPPQPQGHAGHGHHHGGRQP